MSLGLCAYAFRRAAEEVRRRLDTIGQGAERQLVEPHLVALEKWMLEESVGRRRADTLADDSAKPALGA